MALPKLETPTYELELPSTGEKVKYRPFLVKEQKILMLAQESDNDAQTFEMMAQLINSCTFNKINVSQSPVFDVEYIFLKLRAKSVGETTTINVLCPDDNVTYASVKINIDEIDVQMIDEHTNEVYITDNIKLTMNYPLLNDMKGVKLGNTQHIFNLLKKCIGQIQHGDETHNRVDIQDKELDEFIDNLNTEQFEKIVNFFNTMPKLRHVVTVNNPKTKKESQVILEGLESFLE